MAKNKHTHDLGLDDPELHLLVYGPDFDKTIEAEMRDAPTFPHIFTRKYTDFRRGRKKQK